MPETTGIFDPDLPCGCALCPGKGQTMFRNITLVLVIIGLFGCSTGKPSKLGIRSGKLADCPETPNCVSSQSPDQQHFVEPILFEGSAQEAKKRLIVQ